MLRVVVPTDLPLYAYRITINLPVLNKTTLYEKVYDIIIRYRIHEYFYND